MKKLFVILITLVYGLSSTGAIVNLDYCCGKLADISILPVEQNDCKDGCCMNPKTCCDSKQIFLKVKGEQEVAAKWVNAQKQTVSTTTIMTAIAEIATSYDHTNKFSTGPPPDHFLAPLFVQHCVFRI